MSSRLTASNGRRAKLNLPERSGLEEVERARAELERLNNELRENDERRRALLQEREEAKQADLTLAARAIRGGKAAPKTRQVDAVDAEIEKTEEYSAALNEALDQVEDELVAAVEQLRPQRLQELVQRLADEKTRWLELVDGLEAQYVAVNTVASLERWYKAFPGSPAFRAGSFGHLNIRGTGGSTYTPAAVLAELRAAFDERAAPGRPPTMPIPEGGPTPLTKIPSRHAA
jgi:HD-GYP domain-containing protein (c-di-GMP phosphodiesterase class II)